MAVKEELLKSHREGVLLEEIEPRFQLRVNVQKGEIPSGAEVYVYWKGKPPEEFVQSAKDLGLSNEIYKEVVCKAIPVMKEALKLNPRLKFTFKLYRMQIENFETLGELLNIFRQEGISYRNIELEADLEFLYEKGKEKLRTEIMKGLFYLSITTNLVLKTQEEVCLPLKLLKELIIEKVKWGKGIIEEVFRNMDSIKFEGDVRLLKALVRFFKDLNMSVIADGVDRKEVVDFLYLIGVDELQGPYYGGIVTGEEFLKLLKERMKRFL
jgi:EAL domain-containing protein (putative c-di-GMP-specific phosphodiesterase class I)